MSGHSVFTMTRAEQIQAAQQYLQLALLETDASDARRTMWAQFAAAYAAIAAVKTDPVDDPTALLPVVDARTQLLPVVARGAVPRQTCPSCGRPVNGLFALCSEPACVSVDIAATVQMERACEAGDYR